MTLRARTRPLTFNCHLLSVFLLYSSGLLHSLPFRSTLISLSLFLSPPSFFSLLFSLPFSSLFSSPFFSFYFFFYYRRLRHIGCVIGARRATTKSPIEASGELADESAGVN